MKHLSFLLILIGLSWPAFAQFGGGGSSGMFYRGNFFALDLTMNSIAYEEPGVMREDGLLGGARAEVGIGLTENLGISVGGTYYDGSLLYDGATFGGTPVKTRTTDYFRNLKAQFNYLAAPFVVSVGYAQRTWYDDLVISYRRLTNYKYVPVLITMFRGPYYFQLEYDYWLEGVNKSFMSDTGGAYSDVTVKQNDGSGIGLEIGRMINASPIAARAYLRYHKWSVADSEVGFDGVRNLQEPENNTVTITAGIGILL